MTIMRAVAMLRAPQCKESPLLGLLHSEPYTVFTVCVVLANTKSLDFARPFATRTAALRSG